MDRTVTARIARHFALLVLYGLPAASYADQAQLVIINETGADISFFWVDPNGQEQPYGTVAPGQQAVQPTWPGHHWTVHQGSHTWNYTVKDQPVQQELRIRTSADGPAPPPPPPPPHTGFQEGRFLPCDASPPELAQGPIASLQGTPLADLPHGDYNFPPVIRFQFAQGNAAILSTTDAGYMVLPLQQAMGAVYGTGNNIVQLTDGSSLTWRGQRWCAATPYDHIASSASDDYGGAFRPPPAMHQLMYFGWDLGAVDPRQLQVGGFRQKVIAYPDANSNAYHRAEVGAGFVPDGIAMHAIDLGRSQQVSLTHYSEASWATAWSVSLGGHASVLGVGGVGGSTSFAHSLEQMASTQSVVGQSSVEDVLYTLLIDFPRVQLSQAFHDRVMQLAQQLQAGQQPDFEGFSRAFGTHYAAAMSFGGAVYCESMFNESDYSELQSNQISAAAHASVDLEGVLSVGGDVAGSYSFSPGFKERHGSSQQACRSSGGTLGSSGWSLALGQEQPVFADFRPLSDFFNSVYFDDPSVWNLWAPYQNWLAQYTANRTDVHRPSNNPPNWMH